MTSPSSEPRTRSLYHAAVISPVTALALVLAAIATIYAIQVAAAAAGLPILVGASASFAAPALVIAAVARGRRRVFGLGRAAPRFFLAAGLVGIALWYVNLQLVGWILPPPSHPPPLEPELHAHALAPTLAALAIMPAIAEELIFRGVLARALAPRLGVALAALVTAAAFSAYHIELLQLIPTFSLGLALAFIAIRADSAWPTMLAHALNNTAAIALARDGRAVAWIDGHQLTMTASCLVVVAAGIAIAGLG